MVRVPESVPEYYQSVYLNATVVLASPPTSGQVHCSSLASCSLLMHFSLYCFTLFIITAAQFSIFTQVFSCSTLGVWQLVFRQVAHGDGDESNAGNFSTPTHYYLRREPLHRCIFHLDLDAKKKVCLWCLWCSTRVWNNIALWETHDALHFFQLVVQFRLPWLDDVANVTLLLLCLPFIADL